VRPYFWCTLELEAEIALTLSQILTVHRAIPLAVNRAQSKKEKQAKQFARDSFKTFSVSLN
jgi:hypothetical protein